MKLFSQVSFGKKQNVKSRFSAAQYLLESTPKGTINIEGVQLAKYQRQALTVPTLLVVRAFVKMYDFFNFRYNFYALSHIGRTSFVFLYNIDYLFHQVFLAAKHRLFLPGRFVNSQFINTLNSEVGIENTSYKEVGGE